MATTTITADSKPVYCVFGGADCWTCDDLIEWHKLMAVKYGQTQANLNFIQSWDNDTPFICKQADCRSFNTTFRSYMKSVGLLDSLYSGIGVVATPIGVITDVAHSGSQALQNTANVLKYLVPALTIVVALVLIFWVIKNTGVKIPITA